MIIGFEWNRSIDRQMQYNHERLEGTPYTPLRQKTIIGMEWQRDSDLQQQYSYDHVNERFLIKENDEYKSYIDNQWKTVSTTTPTVQQFQEHGMEDLSILDRKVQPVLDSPISMSSETLEEAELDIIANYSPLDEFEEFEVVTWTDDEKQENKTLDLHALPHGQLVFSESDLNIELVESLAISATGIKIIVSTDQGSTWHTFNKDSWETVEANKEAVKRHGMTSDEFNTLTKEELDELLDESAMLRFAYYLEQEQPEDEVYAENISVTTKPAATETPILEGIQIDYDELTIEGRMKDLEEANAINMNKLNFKANALMQSEKYKLHDLVIDTFEEDSMITVEGGSPVEEAKSLSGPEAFDGGYVSKVNIDTPKKILDFEVK